MTRVFLVLPLVALACTPERTPVDDGEESGSDAGTPTPDAGPVADAGPDDLVVPTPAEVAVRFGECPAATTCGGALDGSWAYTDYCMADPVAPFMRLCSTATVPTLEGTVKGGVVFGFGHAVRHLEGSLHAVISVPSICATFAGGCTAVQNLLANSSWVATCTTTGGGNCSCDGTQAIALDETGPYTAADGTISTEPAGGTPRTYGYCVEGNTFKYTETTASGALPGTGTLTKQP